MVHLETPLYPNTRRNGKKNRNLGAAGNVLQKKDEQKTEKKLKKQ